MDGTTVFSYQDSHPRNYYCFYSSSNPIGYVEDDTEERRNREHTLIANAINSIKCQIPTSLDLDTDNDGRVDNICFIIQGATNSGILWPHKWSLFSKSEYINSKRVYNYNLQLTNYLHLKGVGVLSHEMGHTLGAPDLYHKSGFARPVGQWELMANEGSTPQHTSSYVKYKYMHFIDSISEIQKSGTYSLNPLSASSSNNCYKISMAGTSEYLVLEYRKKIGLYDSVLPNSGLLIYRINPLISGNYNGVGYGGSDDEIYLFRVDGTLSSNGLLNSAPLSKDYSRSTFYNSTNPYCFISNGTFGNVYIKNVSTCGNVITFDVRFCDDENVVISNTNNVPNNVNASNSISTAGSVTITSNKNVKLEAGKCVVLNSGFMIENGGQLEININPCGNK